MGKIIEMVSCENIPQYAMLNNEISIEINDGCEWYGHAYASCVGMIYNDGTVKSYFKRDNENGNTETFDKLRNDIHLVKKYVKLINFDTHESVKGFRYFVPYKVKNHCSDKPTVTNDYVDNSNNVHYSVEYEILLVARDGYKRYITVEYETEGTYSSCFFDEIENTESMFEEWFKEGSHGFKIVENDCKVVEFYDETGETCEIDIYSIRELMRMIASIRVIKCESMIVD